MVLDELREKLNAHLAGECSAFYLAQADSGLISFVNRFGTIGITATCDGFYGPQGRRLRVGLRYPQLLERLVTFQYQDLNVVNFEMETAAILGL